MSKKITIEPVTRVEGHGKVTIDLDDAGNVSQTRLHIVEFRGFERFVQGRPYWEAPVLVQRLCGICPVSHHLAAAKALDVIVGAGTGTGLTPTGEKMRRLMHYGQMFQSHALHFFHLVSPDLLFGYDGDPAIRNVIGVAIKHPDLAVQGVMMRKFGQELIAATAGKKIHGTGAIPGGINKNLSIEERDSFIKGADPMNIEKMVAWAQGALDFFKGYHAQNRDFIDNYAFFPSNHLSLVRKDGALDLYHGVLRAVDAEGNRVLDDVDYQDYLKYIGEEVRSWSYMKFPFMKHLGKEKGWYRVGPLARLNTCDFIPTPLAQKEFEEFKAYTKGKANNHCMHMHWARLIELLYSAEYCLQLATDPEITSKDLRTPLGEIPGEGVGIVEAQRGTLTHHYWTDKKGIVTKANIIVGTTNNNAAICMSIKKAAQGFIKKGVEINDGILNLVEMAFRAYDPCFSCATHSLPGKMPMEVRLRNADGDILQSVRRD